MRYLLIDKIIRIEPNKRIIAVKNVALSEDVFTDHFVGYPVLPGAMQIEAIAQAATALLEISANFKVKAILTFIEKVKFRKIIRPGDQLLITLTLMSRENNTVFLDGTISVGNKIAMDGKFIFSLQNVDKFYPKKTRYLIESIYKNWLEDAQIIKPRKKGKGKNHE